MSQRSSNAESAATRVVPSSKHDAPRCVVESHAFTDEAHIECWNQRLAALDARSRVQRALEHLPGQHVLTSSFGAQAAVSLHLLTREMPDIPVILLDTGYLFPETYTFIDELTERLQLNLKVYRSPRSPAWQEARDGQRWLQGIEGIDAYNQENKVEPMKRALKELEVGTWFTGLRRSQSTSRTETPFVQYTGTHFKVNPIADWNDREVFLYLKAHDLPYHPLWEKGYVSIGDTHTTVSIDDAESAEGTRFFGLKRECGLHDTSFDDPGLSGL